MFIYITSNIKLLRQDNLILAETFFEPNMKI